MPTLGLGDYRAAPRRWTTIADAAPGRMTMCLRDNGQFVAMAVGSGSRVGDRRLLLGVVPSAVLVPLVVGLLLFSAVKVRRHA
ncbi:hypothetical protein [Modestobacter sp. SYSU DS0511]